MPVFVDVMIVVQVNEIVAGRLPKDDDHRQRQQCADGRDG